MPISFPYFLAVHGKGMREVLVLSEDRMPHFQVGFITRFLDARNVIVDAPNVDTVLCPVGVTRTFHGVHGRMRVLVCETRPDAEKALADFDATPHDFSFNRDDELNPGEIVECEFE